MAFESLTDKLQNVFKNLRSKGRLTEADVKEAMKEVKRALLEADVNFRVVKSFVKTVTDRAIGQDVLTGLNPGQMVIKIVKEEMESLMGSEMTELVIKQGNEITVFLMAGLQGAGKTTTCAKIAGQLKKKGKKPLLVACDVYRPAAIDQLTVLSEQVGVAIYKEIENKNPVEIATHAIAYAKEHGLDVVIIDTAGRLAVDEAMMNEIEAVKKAINPSETLFVVDSMTGQDAVNTAKAFNDRLNFDGVVLTKLDGDTRGGAALSIKYTVGKPIKFVSTGEKMDALDVFYPDRMAQRILGMGDIVSFVEKAQEQFDEAEAARIEKKIKRNKFDFNDFLSQINQIKKMGDIKSLINMIPGMSKMTANLDIDEKAFGKVECIIQSMTPQERGNPELLNPSRKRRIAKGAGKDINEINMFIKQFDQMRGMMHNMSTGKGMGNMGMPGMGRLRK